MCPDWRKCPEPQPPRLVDWCYKSTSLQPACQCCARCMPPISLFPCPDEFLARCSIVCKCLAFFHCPDDLLDARQFVSCPCSLAIFPWWHPHSMLNREWVTLTCQLVFAVLMTPLLCTQQDMSSPCLLALFHCPDGSLIPHLTESSLLEHSYGPYTDLGSFGHAPQGGHYDHHPHPGHHCWCFIILPRHCHPTCAIPVVLFVSSTPNKAFCEKSF
jgi:hypothetical protein